MSRRQPRQFEKDGRKIEITGPTNKCQVLIDGQSLRGLMYFNSLRAARSAAIGPNGYSKRHRA